MRIATSTIFDRGIASIEDQSSKLLKINEQMGAQRRILTPSDDPVASARALEVSQSISTNTQFQTNQQSAQSSLGLEDSTLSSVGDLLQQTRQLAVEAGNASYDNANRASIADELRSNLQALLSLANTSDGNGHYMFSGYKGGTAPFSTASGANAPVVYNGDQGQRLVQIDASRQVPISDSGANVFMSVKNGNGTFVTAPAATNGGSGVIDPGTVTDPTKWNAAGLSKNYAVVFRNLPTSVTGTALAAGQEIGVADPSTWAATGQNVTVSFGAGTYTVTDNTHQTTSGPIAYAGTPISIQGTGLSFNFAPAAGAAYTVSGTSTTYDLVDNATGNSLITGAAPAAPGQPLPRTYTSGQTIAFNNLAVPAAGSDYGANVTVNGAPGNNDKFTVQASTNESMFKTIDDLANLLATGVRNGAVGTNDRATLTNGINKALSNLSNDIDKISTVRATVGARLNELDAAQSLGQDVSTQLQQNLSNLQDLDFAKAVSDLTKQQTALQAAQMSYTKVTGLSLFNFL